MERNGEILVKRNYSIVSVKKGFLDKLEMTKKNIFHIFVVRIKISTIFAA